MLTRAKRRVLVVDDYPELAANLREILEDAGYGVTTAFGAAAAIAVLERITFSVAIVDLRLAIEGEGFALIESLSRRAPALPLVVKALYRDEVDAARALHPGRIEAMVEPVCFSTLCTLVDRIGREAAPAASRDETATGGATLRPRDA